MQEEQEEERSRRNTTRRNMKSRSNRNRRRSNSSRSSRISRSRSLSAVGRVTEGKGRAGVGEAGVWTVAVVPEGGMGGVVHPCVTLLNLQETGFYKWTEKKGIKSASTLCSRSSAYGKVAWIIK